MHTKKTLTAVCCLFASFSYAGSMGETAKHMLREVDDFVFGKKTDWMLYGGVYGITQGIEQHININGLVGNQYIPTNRRDGNALAGVGVFKDLYSMRDVTMQAGVQLFYLGASHVAGQVLLENVFNNVNYNYSVSYLPLYFDLKANLKTQFDKLGLVLDAGVGPDFISFRRYTETPLLLSTIPDNAYTGQSATSISATFGAGARVYRLPNDGWFEVSYRFFYLGDAKLNSYNPQYLTALDAGSMFANAFVLSVHV